MYADAARFYDLIHDARGRDARAEADLVIGEIRRRNPAVRTLLDVACGTGAHLPRFAEEFDVAGIDASGAMLAIAAARSPGVPLTQDDMRTFGLQRTFDAVVCLFSGIGYLTEEADLRRAVATMASHLGSGGVLLIEGWVEPEYWIGSTINVESGRTADVAVARVVRSQRDGVHCRIAMRYVAVAATAATATGTDGFTTVEEDHTMRLSVPTEFEAAYRDAGLTFERLPHMLHPGRAVYAGMNHPG
jgi:SAM-dependent methyltransferase